MKTTFRSIGVAFLSLTSAFAAAPPKIETASPPEGVFVTYGFGVGHNTVVELKGGKFRYWFSSDRKGADVEALEGTYTADGDKIVLTHPKLIPLVSEWTVRSIDGVVTLWRSDALKLLEEDKLDLYRIGKDNFFRTGNGSILVPSRKTAEEAWKSPQFAVLTEAERKALTEPQNRRAEQDGGGQPATRPESKWPS